MVISYTILANTLAVGEIIKWNWVAVRAGTSSTPAPILRIRIGATTLTGAVVWTDAGLVTSSLGNYASHGEIVFKAIGVTGTASAGGWSGGNTSGTATINHIATGIDVVVDTTVDNLVEITFSSGNATNTYTFQTATLFQYPPP